MKNSWIFILFLSSFLYAQHKETLDSVKYYEDLAEANIQINKFKNALFYTQKAIDYAEENKDPEAQAAQTLRLGKIYFDLKRYTDAEESLSKSLPLFESLPPTIQYAEANYYIGLTEVQNSNYKAAKTYFNKALSINKLLKIDKTIDLINLQKAIILRKENAVEEASLLFNTIISKPNSITLNNTKAEALYQMGLVELAKNRINLALNYYNNALELNKNTQNLEQKSNILLAISIAYEKQLDKSNAYLYLKQHLNLKESLALLNNEKLGIDDYENFKESQRLDKEAKIYKQKAEHEKTNKFSKLINILSIALISILSLLSLSLYKNNIIRNKTNLLLNEKNNELVIAKEKAEKASQARSEFLSIVSHELRTPLNAINGITHLLLEENPKKSQLHYLSSLQFSGNYLTTFINDILEINRIESNRVELEKISFNIKQLLENIKNSLLEVAIKNNNNFELIIDDAIPENLYGDTTKLSQIFMNLINNALKFTKNGSVTIRATLLSFQEENTAVSFQIEDTGIGIAPDKLETVFENFAQGSVEINRKYGGTGLGLTIVKKLTTLLGGQIKLKSTLGKGSLFTVELPFEVDKNKEIKKEIKLTCDLSLLAIKKVLIVEDNKINQMITRRMLESKGILCEVIDNGEDSIKAVKENYFDLVLMDVHLPGINGTVATQKIREFNSKIPVIALTAISLDENREMLLSYGMNDVVTKPFIPEEFYAALVRNI
ncbi:ATP-binding protein [Flavobacterium sp.]|uniref:tetratricopeptide repeat-containing hybrid sensor histidine kinase/response regulator n=1 Tax=Flavobacterium sp. TaxID=239 RepID=UPI00262179C0|nr:ATP-binding protein [Flavobacterium sp.]MDG2431259.1 ATP-binding protein [Flavobacterium sp.]